MAQSPESQLRRLANFMVLTAAYHYVAHYEVIDLVLVAMGVACFAVALDYVLFG